MTKDIFPSRNWFALTHEIDSSHNSCNAIINRYQQTSLAFGSGISDGTESYPYNIKRDKMTVNYVKWLHETYY